MRFFIGLNGSGKSVFLEGICFLFSRIVQNESPGFAFTLIYRIRRERLYQIQVTNGAGEERLDIQVMAEGEDSLRRLHTFEGHRELLPDYVFTCASGRNNHYFDIMVHSPRTSLYSDLFDRSLLGKSRKDREERRRDIERVLGSLKALEENPISMFVDEENSLFVLAALFAVLPKEDSQRLGSYLQCRGEILAMLDHIPVPAVLSFTLDAKRVEESGGELEQYGAVFWPIAEDYGKSVKKPANEETWSTTRLYQDEAADVENAHGDQVISFLFAPHLSGDRGSFVIKELNDFYRSPMEFLSKLILARNRGIIKEVHMVQVILDYSIQSLVQELDFEQLTKLVDKGLHPLLKKKVIRRDIEQLFQLTYVERTEVNRAFVHDRDFVNHIDDKGYCLHFCFKTKDQNQKPLEVLNRLCNDLYDNISKGLPGNEAAFSTLILQSDYEEVNGEYGLVCPVCMKENLFGMGEGEVDHYFPRKKISGSGSAPL